MAPLDPIEILVMWESQYGKLSRDWHSRFFNHEAMKLICENEYATVQEAIRLHKRLWDIRVFLTPRLDTDDYGRDWDQEPHNSSLDILNDLYPPF